MPGFKPVAAEKPLFGITGICHDICRLPTPAASRCNPLGHWAELDMPWH